MRPLTPPPAIPTGPLHSFQALAYPLPEDAQKRLKQLALAVQEAPRDAKQAAMTALNDYTATLRNAIGSELCRREFQ